MAITVQHAPDMRLLAESGYQAGSGLFQQQQRELALQERMQQRALQYNLISQRIAHENALERQGFAAEDNMRSLAIQNRAGLMRQQMQNNFQRELGQLERQDRAEFLQHQLQQQRERIQLTGQSFQERDIVQHLTSAANERIQMINELQSSGVVFTPQQQEEFAALNREMDTLANNPTVPPMAMANGMYQLAMRMPIPKQPERTMGDDYKVETLVEEDPNRPGVKMPLSKNRNGEWQLIQGYKLPEPEKEEQEPKKVEYFDDAENFAKHYSEAALKPITEKKGEETVTRYRTPEEVDQHIENMRSSFEKSQQARAKSRIKFRGREYAPMEQRFIGKDKVNVYTTPPEVETEEDFEAWKKALPSGAVIIGPDGREYRKT